MKKLLVIELSMISKIVSELGPKMQKGVVDLMTSLSVVWHCI